MEQKTIVKKLVEETWSDYCDLDYWIDAMTRGDQKIPKNVLKMAMKHLRDDLYRVHDFLCKISESHEFKEREITDTDLNFIGRNKHAAVNALQLLLQKED